MKVSRSLQSMHMDSSSCRSTLSKKVLKHSIATVLAAVALSGCQSTPFAGQHQSSALTAIMASQPASEQQSLLAQQTLLQAMQKQRKTAYRYRIDMIGSNQSRLNAFEKATKQQLSMSDVSERHCEHMHDEAYASLLEQAELDEKDIEDDNYATQRKALKSAFIDCKSKQVAWEDSRYERIASTLDTGSPEDEQTISADDILADIIEEEGASTDSENASQQSLDELLAGLFTQISDDKFLPNYDSAHTKQDAHKAKLLNAYLLQPSSISTQGVYQPLLGKMSVVPTLRYQAPNLTSIANHYIYLDAKQGAIYFWADTYAYLLSIYFDEQLGASMHNKWLKLNLNDGSLPAGFGKDLIESHFAAKDKSLQQIPAQRFKILSNSELLAAEPKLDARFIPYVQQASYVIERRLTDEDVEVNLSTYFSTLYQLITDKYPELKSELHEMQTSASEDVLSISELQQQIEEEAALAEDEKFEEWVKSESAIDHDIDAYNEDADGDDEKSEAQKDADENESIKAVTSKYSSRQLLVKLLAYIENNLEPQTAETNQDKPAITNSTDQADKTEEAANKKYNPDIDYARYAPDSAENQWLWRDIYAVDASKHIQWHFKQYKMAEDAPEDGGSDVFRGIELQSLTRYEPVNVTASLFTPLPEGTSAPNVENTIDIRQYTQTLLQRYEQGGGTPMGRKALESIKEGQIPITMLE